MSLKYILFICALLTLASSGSDRAEVLSCLTESDLRYVNSVLYRLPVDKQDIILQDFDNLFCTSMTGYERGLIISALGELGDVAAISDLKSILHEYPTVHFTVDMSGDERSRIIKALAKMGNSTSIRTKLDACNNLIFFSDNMYGYQRCRVIESLAELPDCEAISTLGESFKRINDILIASHMNSQRHLVLSTFTKVTKGGETSNLVDVLSPLLASKMSHLEKERIIKAFDTLTDPKHITVFCDVLKIFPDILSRLSIESHEFLQCVMVFEELRDKGILADVCEILKAIPEIVKPQRFFETSLSSMIRVLGQVKGRDTCLAVGEALKRITSVVANIKSKGLIDVTDKTHIIEAFGGLRDRNTILAVADALNSASFTSDTKVSDIVNAIKAFGVATNLDVIRGVQRVMQEHPTLLLTVDMNGDDRYKIIEALVCMWNRETNEAIVKAFKNPILFPPYMKGSHRAPMIISLSQLQDSNAILSFTAVVEKYADLFFTKYMTIEDKASIVDSFKGMSATRIAELSYLLNQVKSWLFTSESCPRDKRHIISVLGALGGCKEMYNVCNYMAKNYDLYDMQNMPTTSRANLVTVLAALDEATTKLVHETLIKYKIFDEKSLLRFCIVDYVRALGSLKDHAAMESLCESIPRLHKHLPRQDYFSGEIIKAMAKLRSRENILAVHQAMKQSLSRFLRSDIRPIFRARVIEALGMLNDPEDVLWVSEQLNGSLAIVFPLDMKIDLALARICDFIRTEGDRQNLRREHGIYKMKTELPG